LSAGVGGGFPDDAGLGVADVLGVDRLVAGGLVAGGECVDAPVDVGVRGGSPERSSDDPVLGTRDPVGRDDVGAASDVV
jgi:hypothetical protein